MQEVVLVELIIEPDDAKPYSCGHEGVFPDKETARQWVQSAWPDHKDHGHVIEINPEQGKETGVSLFANFITLPFGRGLSEGPIRPSSPIVTPEETPR